MDEGHVQPWRPGDAQALQQGFLLRRLLGRGTHGNGRALGQDAQIRPHGVQPLADLRRRAFLQVGQGVDLQPGQQRVARRQGQLLRVLLVEGALQHPVGRQEIPALLLRPLVLRRKAQRRLQLREAPQAAEADLIDAAETVEVHEFVVDLNLDIVRIFGNQPGHDAGNGRRTVAFQDADALVALGDVEAAHVLVADDGVGDAHGVQMGRAQGDPLGAELRLRIQQGHEIPREDRLAPRGGGAHDLIHGDVHQPDVGPARAHVLAEDLVQHLGVGIAAADHAAVVILEPLLQGIVILQQGVCSAHVVPPCCRPAASG